MIRTSLRAGHLVWPFSYETRSAWASNDPAPEALSKLRLSPRSNCDSVTATLCGPALLFCCCSIFGPTCVNGFPSRFGAFFLRALGLGNLAALLPHLLKEPSHTLRSCRPFLHTKLHRIITLWHIQRTPRFATCGLPGETVRVSRTSPCLLAG